LLVVVAAVVYPALEGPLSSERLRRGADQVRAAWTRTRIKAMTTGSPHVFRYQPETGIYQVEIWSGAEAQIEASSLADFGIHVEPAVVSHAAGEKGLPEGVVFDANQTNVDLRALMIGADQLTPQGGTGGAAWSDPIYFFPDGTTSTTRLMLRNERMNYVILDLRGLTGVTTVSDVLTADEVAQQ
jgi:hypothetical protein